MKFKDGRLCVPMLLTDEDRQRAAQLGAPAEARTHRRQLLPLALTLCFLAAITTATCGVGTFSILMYLLFVFMLYRKAGKAFFPSHFPKKLRSREPIYTLVSFGRSGCFHVDEDIYDPKTDDFYYEDYTDYSEITQCIEDSDMLYLSIGRFFYHIYIPARFLSHSAAQEITALLRAKCGAKYTCLAPIVAQSEPQSVSAPELFDCEHKLLYELEYSLTEQECAQTGTDIRNSQYGVRIALYRHAAVIRICGDERIFRYDELSVSDTPGFLLISTGKESKPTAVPRYILAEHAHFMTILSKRLEKEGASAK